MVNFKKIVKVIGRLAFDRGNMQVIQEMKYT